MFGGYVRGLGRFLAQPVESRAAAGLVVSLLEKRAEHFLSLLRTSVFGSESSPYLPLLRHAGITVEDVTSWVGSEGLEGTLDRLHAAGVYVTLSEYKGHEKIRRGSLEYGVDTRAFENPHGGARFAARSSGSRSARRRLLIDFDVMGADAAYHSLFMESFGISGGPAAMWRTGPPDASGLRNALVHVKAGGHIHRWFSHNRLAAGPHGWKNAAFAAATSALAGATGRRIPIPEHLPISRAGEVARWLAEHRAAGRTPSLNTMVGSALRVCLAARRAGLDISGTVMRVGGEPLTAGRASVFWDLGVRVGCHYAMTEVGAIAMACSGAARPDEAHVLDGKLALTTHPVTLPLTGESVSGFHLTTVHPSSPKVLINVETGDFGEVETGACGCRLGEIGLQRRVHSILSHEKLTSEGMTFLVSEVLELLDSVLPRVFGGTLADYQLVEADRDGLPVVRLVVSPRVGRLDESEVCRVATEFLASGHGGRHLMTGVWLQANTLRIERRDPHVSAVGKILPLHVMRLH